MSDLGLLARLEASAAGVAVAESPWLFPALESAHVVALALVVGSIGMMDLRLLGLIRRETPVTSAAAEILPWTWSAFAVAATTGAFMFVSRAGDYWDNPFFRAKLALLALAGLNMASFHLLTWRSVARWEVGPPPAAARLAGGLSLAAWTAVVICGRWVGFV